MSELDSLHGTGQLKEVNGCGRLVQKVYAFHSDLELLFRSARRSRLRLGLAHAVNLVPLVWLILLCENDLL